MKLHTNQYLSDMICHVKIVESIVVICVSLSCGEIVKMNKMAI